MSCRHPSKSAEVFRYQPASVRAICALPAPCGRAPACWEKRRQQPCHFRFRSMIHLPQPSPAALAVGRRRWSGLSSPIRHWSWLLVSRGSSKVECSVNCNAYDVLHWDRHQRRSATQRPPLPTLKSVDWFRRQTWSEVESVRRYRPRPTSRCRHRRCWCRCNIRVPSGTWRSLGCISNRNGIGVAAAEVSEETVDNKSMQRMKSWSDAAFRVNCEL